MYNALTLSHYYVSLSLNTNIPITPHKAEFMVYFAHGWHLSIDGRPLINDKVKAWRHGPVIESIHKFYSKGKGDIYSTIDEQALGGIKERDREFLNGIWLYYGHLNEIEMLTLCTEDKTPWFMSHQKSSGELIIDNRRIKQHYRLLHISNPEFCDLDDPISVESRHLPIGKQKVS